ncbi:MAG: hypothetical protein LBL27_04575 [Coriobacteriales bacterium]|jgi:hypothetical protein|nr:hypothetical protein [Coriobacteriales bacterium]
MTTEDYSVDVTDKGTNEECKAPDENPAAGGREGRPVGEKRGAPTVKNALVYYLRPMGLTTLWFLGIFALVFLLLVFFATSARLIFSSPLVGYELGSEGLIFSAILSSAGSVYLLVMGITMQTYLETMLSFGLTRRQNTLALLLGSALMALLLTLIGALITALFGSEGPDPSFNLPLWHLRVFLSGWLSYLLGWFIVIGYQYRHTLAALLSTAMGATLLLFSSSGDGWGLFPLINSALGSDETLLLRTGSSLLLSLVLIAAIIPLTRRIPIKV